MWQHQPNHLELGRLEQFKALSTYWDVFCGSGGLWTATVLDSGSPMSRTVTAIPSSRSSSCQSKARHRGFLKKKNKQPQKSVLESHLFIQQLFVCFTLIQCVLLSLPLCEGTCWSGQGGSPQPPPPTHWKGLSQPSVPDAFPPLLPSLNTRNDPFQHSKGRSVGVGDTCFMYSPSVTGQREILYLTTTPVFWSPYGLFARRPIGFSVRAFVYSSSKRWHLCVSSVPLSGSVGWTCLSAAISSFLFSKDQGLSLLCSWSQWPTGNMPSSPEGHYTATTTNMTQCFVFLSIINECSSYNQQTTVFKTIHTVKRHPQHL